MYAGLTLTQEQYQEIRRAAIDWQYLVVQVGGMARKSDCENWLIPCYGIDRYTAHSILNDITDGPRHFYCSASGVTWDEWNARRPAPRREDYPDIPGLF